VLLVRFVEALRIAYCVACFVEALRFVLCFVEALRIAFHFVLRCVSCLVQGIAFRCDVAFRRCVLRFVIACCVVAS
jgi:hypothetical protein